MSVISVANRREGEGGLNGYRETDTGLDIEENGYAGSDEKYAPTHGTHFVS